MQYLAQQISEYDGKAVDGRDAPDNHAGLHTAILSVEKQ
jgi:hypothetical protein